MDATEVVRHNRRAWDYRVAEGDEWTRGVSPEQIARARAGDLTDLVLIGHEPVPRAWLPDALRGVSVLCLASGGGQQGPLLAAAGATVTVFDNSPAQLERDREVAEREGLEVRTVLGDMRDLGAFANESFALVLHPVANVFCPELAPVWAECFRVLRSGGHLLSGFMNPDLSIFDEALLDRGEFLVRHPLPYADDPEGAAYHQPIGFSHTMTDQIGGQIEAGFAIVGFAELPHHANATARFMPGYFATRALKRQR